MKKFFFYFPNHQHRKTPWIKDVKLDNWKKQNFNSALEISILYTYFVLKNYGFNCELVSKLPKKGIVFVNNKAMRKIPSFNPNLFLINMQVDKTRYIFADLHVVFNQALSCELDKAFNTSYLEPSFYIPHWVSDKIIKRSKLRKNSFDNIIYMGANGNLSSEFKSAKWKNDLKQHGLTFNIERKKWYDFENFDLSFFVRKTGVLSGIHKPAQKLYNSWAAGVPVICGNEIEILLSRKSKYDFLIVNNYDEALNKVLFLKKNNEFRNKMISNGLERYKREFSTDIIIKKWEFFLKKFLPYEFDRWQKRTKTKKFSIYLSKCLSKLTTDLETKMKV